MKTLKIVIEAKSVRSDCCTILNEMTGPVINLPRDDVIYKHFLIFQLVIDLEQICS